VTAADVLAQLEAGELGEPLVLLAFLAGRELDLPEAVVAGARCSCSPRAATRAAVSTSTTAR
jgi:hypothetical protein